MAPGFPTVGKTSHYFMMLGTDGSVMSDATKIVLGTIAISTALGVAIIVNHAVA